MSTFTYACCGKCRVRLSLEKFTHYEPDGDTSYSFAGKALALARFLARHSDHGVVMLTEHADLPDTDCLLDWQKLAADRDATPEPLPGRMRASDVTVGVLGESLACPKCKAIAAHPDNERLFGYRHAEQREKISYEGGDEEGRSVVSLTCPGCSVRFRALLPQRG